MVNCNLLKLSGLLSSKKTRQRSLGIPSSPPSTTVANRVSNTPTLPLPAGRPAPLPSQPKAKSSAVAYPPPRGLPWKCIAAIMQEDKSYPGCRYNHPEDSPQLKFHQEVGCPALAKHGYLFWKDVMASAKFVDQFNTKFPKIPNQYRTSKPVAKRVSDDQASDHVLAKRFHPPLISNPPLNSSVPPAPIEKNLLILPNQSAPMTKSNSYADLYSSNSEDEPVFKEMVDIKTLKPINTYYVVHLSKNPISTPHEVLKKQRTTHFRTHPAAIK